MWGQIFSLWTCERHKSSKGLGVEPGSLPADMQMQQIVGKTGFIEHLHDFWQARQWLTNKPEAPCRVPWAGALHCSAVQCSVQGCLDHSRRSWYQANHIGNNSKARVDALLQQWSHCHQMICKKRQQGSHACDLQLAAVPRVCHDHLGLGAHKPMSPRLQKPM